MFRTLESPEPVHRYLELKARIKALTDEMKELEPMIWDAVDEEGGTADFAGYRLESAVSNTYTYSPAVQEAEAEVRQMKAAERQAGVARVERATGFVRVTEHKAADVGADGTPEIDLDALAAETTAPAVVSSDGTPF